MGINVTSSLKAYQQGLYEQLNSYGTVSNANTTWIYSGSPYFKSIQKNIYTVLEDEINEWIKYAFEI